MIRQKARQSQQLTTWPSADTIGIPSQKACVANAKLLELTAMWWTSATEVPAAIPIDFMRSEAG